MHFRELLQRTLGWGRTLRPPEDSADIGTLGSMLKNRCVMLRGEIRELTARDCIAQLLFLGYEARKEPATLYVDSPGGSVTDSIALLRTMADLPYPLGTHCCGTAGGTAAAIIAHGQRGFRTAIPDARFAFAPTFADPTRGYVEAEISQFNRVLIESIAEDTLKHEGEVGALFRSEAALNAEEALQFGFIDTISRFPITPPTTSLRTR